MRYEVFDVLIFICGLMGVLLVGASAGALVERKAYTAHPCDELKRFDACKGEDGSYVCVWVDSDQQLRRVECGEVTP